VPIRGRSLDHIGFEVRNLEAFVRELEAKGVRMDRGYTEVAALGIAIAFLTDPWGTYVELTEGLSAVN
jgi:catechol 2,3-dioxygenase-like lactoylglutathione lyase family enzyme